MTVIAIISTNVPWYALFIVIIGGLIAIAIVGALQLRHDESLSEENFIDLMEKSLKRLPLLRNNDSSERLLIRQCAQRQERRDRQSKRQRARG